MNGSVLEVRDKTEYLKEVPEDSLYEAQSG